MNLQVNSEYGNLVPPLTDEEFVSLKDSIALNGQWIPIISNSEGIVLDGHHRFKICLELKITPKVVIREFENKLLEKKFVIEANLNRRHLNDYQKAELGYPLLKIEKELAEQRMKKGVEINEEDKGPSRKKVSDKIGVKKSTFDKSKQLIEKAPESVKEELRSGKKTINKAYHELRKDEKKTLRQEEIKKIQVSLPKSVTLHNLEFQKAYIEGNSVALIMTDPPYHEKYLYLYEDLAVHASRVLREGGSLLCYVGHYAIGKVINMMEAKGLKFHWMISVIHSGPSASVFGRKILVGYKPMLWFVKGKYDGDFVKDTIHSQFQGKELHDWAQSTVESDYYIKHLTIENDIVYDPFLGQGTFGVSAVKLNRQFIGCEVDKGHFENAERLISVGN